MEGRKVQNHNCKLHAFSNRGLICARNSCQGNRSPHWGYCQATKRCQLSVPSGPSDRSHPTAGALGQDRSKLDTGLRSEDENEICTGPGGSIVREGANSARKTVNLWASV